MSMDANVFARIVAILDGSTHIILKNLQDELSNIRKTIEAHNAESKFQILFMEEL